MPVAAGETARDIPISDRPGGRTRDQGGEAMVGFADDYDPPKRQFWLHGPRSGPPVEYDAGARLWNVYGYPEAQEILAKERPSDNRIAEMYQGGVFCTAEEIPNPAAPRKKKK